MPSEAEKFLGIDKSGRPASVPKKGILRKRWVWVLTLILSYLVSITWLTGAIVCVPYVIWMAPLGFTSLFSPPVNNANARVVLGTSEYIVHLVFWTLFLTALIGCKRMGYWLLRAIFLAVVVILVLTMRGCAEYYHMNTSQIN